MVFNGKSPTQPDNPISKPLALTCLIYIIPWVEWIKPPPRMAVLEQPGQGLEKANPSHW